ncbi:MAG: hypothetical protein DWQ10_00125 [Calditrichaeota bacterium]|nr:MAG: hypothetical protein DWQ10_00125 [Calditrichota bacterium]
MNRIIAIIHPPVFKSVASFAICIKFYNDLPIKSEFGLRNVAPSVFVILKRNFLETKIINSGKILKECTLFNPLCKI